MATSCWVFKKKEFVGAYLILWDRDIRSKNSVLLHGPKFPATVSSHHQNGRAGLNKTRLSQQSYIVRSLWANASEL